MQYKEQPLQMACVEWLQWKGIRCNHSANEGKRTAQEGNKNKKMGTSKGFPDLEIPYPRGRQHGLFVEFKSDTGRLTPEQREWIEFLNQQGYCAVIVRTFEEFEKIVEDYFNER